MSVSWDADKYTQDFSFVHKYGNDLLEMIDFDKVQTAIDLGCGNGALTEKIKSYGYCFREMRKYDKIVKKVKSAFFAKWYLEV